MTPQSFQNNAPHRGEYHQNSRAASGFNNYANNSRKRSRYGGQQAPRFQQPPLKKYRIQVKTFPSKAEENSSHKLLFIGSLIQKDLSCLVDKLQSIFSKLFLHQQANETVDMHLWKEQIGRLNECIGETKIYLLRNVKHSASNKAQETSNAILHDDNGSELIPNTLFDLGKIGMIQIAGLRIAYVSFGVGERSGPGNEVKFGYDASDIASLESSAGSEWEGGNETQIDVLLTCEYPKYVTQHTTQLPAWEVRRSSVQILRLVRTLNPRYHIVSFGNREHTKNLSTVSPYYARPPFSSKSTNNNLITRFYSLGVFLPPGTEDVSKQERKYLYACALKPVKHMTEQDLKELVTDDVTPSPFDRPEAPSRSRLDRETESPRRSTSPVRVLPNQRTPQSRELQTCWFCISNPEVERHLVCMERNHTYIAIPKGGLSLEHSLIVPLAHVSNYRELTPECIAEIETLKDAFRKIFYGDVVFFERALLNDQGRKTHMHIHALPCVTNVDECIEGLQREAKAHFLEFQQYPKDKSVESILEENTSTSDDQTQGFVWIELADGTKMFGSLPEKKRLLPSFARELVAVGACGLNKSQANW
eukprot:CAMPEP_0117454302 /NCGR_PEP_ID=MMETSP0759-20121206/10727_1 /TAXON_ID=63605 /ORGANISM="Percolomonas cosmopolitus, Strain WS" /LENGTH=589 /DNA_ID=CAMNT_0005247477 /DNA_START=46 /DNA_END=1812 /DNA_ORIENTATION=-